jgi:hypothetical protein
MFSNLGKIDRVVRLVAGVAVIALGLVFRNWFGLIGLVLLLTAGIGVCPLYLPFGISTRKPAAPAKP